MSTPHPTRATPTPTPAAIEREVRQNILSQRFGAGTVADLRLPDEFVRRCADRVIIASFNERYRSVEDDADSRPAPQPLPDAPDSPLVQVLQGVTAGRNKSESLPAETAEIIRGARFDSTSKLANVLPPGPDSPYELRRAAAIVAGSLARDGLARTAAAAAATLRPLLENGGSLETLLKQAGLPLDLLSMAALPGSGGFSAGQMVHWLDAKVRAKASGSALRTALGDATIEFRAALPGFVASDDSGGDSTLLARAQLTRGDDWLGEGDGGSLDIVRQLAAMMPNTPLVLSVAETHAAQIRSHARHWAHAAHRSAMITVLSERALISQWAQDNSRAGHVIRNGTRLPAAILPRYASRGEDRSLLVPGDSVITESLTSVGVDVARSPLLFQGGNMIMVNDRASSLRTLLVGEAEVYRNMALGLSESQTLDAFCFEFGADRAFKLPAISYHIDYEVLCATDASTGAIHAFVPDVRAGASNIVLAGLACLQGSAVLSESQADEIRQGLLSEALPTDALNRLCDRLEASKPATGVIPAGLAMRCTAGSAGESATGNFMTFMEAVEALIAMNPNGDRHSANPHAAAAMLARRRLHTDRAAVHRILSSLGWRVHAVPAFPSAARGSSPLNAIARTNAIIIPAVGGMYASADKATIDEIRVPLQDWTIQAMLSAESQRRNGSGRCSVSIFC